MTKVRESWFDRCKGMLIFLVVIGHVIGGARKSTSGDLYRCLDFALQVIATFHMQAFFFLVGCIWTGNGTFKEFAVKKARRLLVPYVCFGLFSWIVFDIVYGVVSLNVWGQQLLSLLHAGGWPNGDGFRCNSVLWFLPCMYVVLCCYWWLDRFCKGSMAQLGVVIALLISRWMLYRFDVHYLPWGIIDATWYLCFVIVGRIMWRGLPSVERNLYIWQRWAILILGSAAFVWACSFDNLQHWKISELSCYFVLGVVGSIGIVEICRLVSWTAFGQLGICSLQIMLLHKFFVVAMQEHVSFFERLLSGGVTSVLCACCLIVLCAITISYECGIIGQKIMVWLKGNS